MKKRRTVLFVLPTPSSSSSSSYVSENEDDEFDVSSDEAESEASDASLNAATVIGVLFFCGRLCTTDLALLDMSVAANPQHTLRKMYPRSSRCSCWIY